MYRRGMSGFKKASQECIKNYCNLDLIYNQMYKIKKDNESFYNQYFIEGALELVEKQIKDLIKTFMYLEKIKTEDDAKYIMQQVGGII